MVSETTIKNKWNARWRRWADKALPVLDSNAKACEDRSGIDKMACIAAKNSETVTKRALGLFP